MGFGEHVSSYKWLLIDTYNVKLQIFLTAIFIISEEFLNVTTLYFCFNYFGVDNYLPEKKWNSYEKALKIT